VLEGDDPGGGAFALFLRPHPGAFRQIMCPHPWEFAHFLKKYANVPGVALGIEGQNVKKNWPLWPESLEAMLEYWNMERGLLESQFCLLFNS